MNILIVARRVLQQLGHDRRFLIFSITIPLLMAYFLKLFFNTLPPGVSHEAYAIPFTAYIIYFLAFILSALLLVQERIHGTLHRMLINGLHRTDIILGYVLGYLTLAVIQAAFVLAEVLWLFELSYDWQVIAALAGSLFILSIVSVLLGIFISTFARREAQVIPFIPLVVVLPAFLSGLIADPSLLPNWAEIVGQFFPISYAITAVKSAIVPVFDTATYWQNLGYLALFAIGLTVVGSFTFKERE
ncbi:ABC transporter permease [Patescibacteria group bacterium]|nr:ABC transporter permease [Patescibacteria group bacterium]